MAMADEHDITGGNSHVNVRFSFQKRTVGESHRQRMAAAAGTARKRHIGRGSPFSQSGMREIARHGRAG